MLRQMPPRLEVDSSFLGLWANLPGPAAQASGAYRRLPAPREIASTGKRARVVWHVLQWEKRNSQGVYGFEYRKLSSISRPVEKFNAIYAAGVVDQLVTVD